MGDNDTIYDKYCKENDEIWEKDKQIKVCIAKTLSYYFDGRGSKKYMLPKLALHNSAHKSTTKYYDFVHFLMQFSIPTAEDVPELKKYLIKEFFTSEPLCKNMIENGGWFSKKLVVGSSASFCAGNNLV